MSKSPNIKSLSAGKQNKDTKKYEVNQVKIYLSEHVATATMVAKELGMYRPSLCRYKRRLEDRGLLKEYGKALCKVTGCMASYLTCKPELMEGGLKNG